MYTSSMVTREVHWSYNLEVVLDHNGELKSIGSLVQALEKCTEVMRCNKEVPIPYTQYALDLSDGITIETT